MTTRHPGTLIVPRETVSWLEKSGEHDLPSPLESVGLSEVFYMRVFAAGLLLGVAVTSLAIGLSGLHTTANLDVGIALSGLALLLALLSARAPRVYVLLRRHNSIALAFAAALCAIALTAGSENQELFYVDIIVLSAIGIAVSMQTTAIASAIAGLGLAAPSLSSPGTVALVAMAMAIPLFFWLLVQYLARFMMRLAQVARSARARQSKQIVHVGDIGMEPQPDPQSPLLLPRRADTSTKWHIAAPRWRSSLAEHRSALTSRQEQAVFLMCAGYEDKEIAELMGISIAIVRRHISGARDRVGAATRGQLAAWAVEQGLI